MTAFNAERLVAGLAVGIQVETEDDVVMLGKAFIEQLIRYWKEEGSLRTNHQLSLQKTAAKSSARQRPAKRMIIMAMVMIVRTGLL